MLFFFFIIIFMWSRQNFFFFLKLILPVQKIREMYILKHSRGHLHSCTSHLKDRQPDKRLAGGGNDRKKKRGAYIQSVGIYNIQGLFFNVKCHGGFKENCFTQIINYLPAFFSFFGMARMATLQYSIKWHYGSPFFSLRIWDPVK